LVRHVSQKSSRNFTCFSGVQPQRKYVKKLKSVDPKGEAQALLPLGGLCAGSEALQYFLFTLFYKMWKFDWLWKAFNESLT